MALDAGRQSVRSAVTGWTDARPVGREPSGRRQEGQDGARLASEARVDRLHPLEAVQEEARSDEQHECDRELCDDQSFAPPELTGLPPPELSLRRAPARGAERQAHRDLLAAVERPRTQEAGEVGARQQQDQRHRMPATRDVVALQQGASEPRAAESAGRRRPVALLAVLQRRRRAERWRALGAAGGVGATRPEAGGSLPRSLRPFT